MRYTVTKQRIQVIGYIWQPGVGMCAAQRDLSDYDMGNIEDLEDRDAVECWVSLNFEDFQSIEDFRADFDIAGKSIVHEWAKGEDSEFAFNDCMYPAED